MGRGSQRGGFAARLDAAAGLTVVVVALALLFAPAAARAERALMRAPPPGEPEPAPEAPTPPELSRFVQADYPEEALAAGREAVVVARVGIDAEGRVTDVEVVEAAGFGFDEAATAAIRQFVFEPARVGERPVASRIVYRYRFTVETEEAPAEETVQRVRARGIVLDVEGRPIVGARVEAYPAEEGLTEEDAYSADTDAEGRFVLGPLVAGPYELLATAPGFVTYRGAEPTVLGTGRELTLRLEVEGAQYETVVRARRPAEQLTTRTVDRREMTRVPGAAGDPLRVIQSLPGMARAPGGIGLLVVRGSAPGDTQVYLEGVSIPLIYHFGGLTSIITPRLLESIDFIPGNYPVRYGGSHGGIIEVGIRELQREPFVGWHGDLEIDLIDAQLSLEGPITDELAFAVAARRSYIDAVAGIIFDAAGDALSLRTAPVYWDYQAVLQWTPSREHFLRLIGLGSDDAFAVLFNDAGESGESVTGSFNTHTYFHGGILQYRYRPSGPLSLDVTAAVRHTANQAQIASLAEFDVADTTYILRPEVVLQSGRWGRFTVGMNIFVDDVRARVRAPRFDLAGLGCISEIVERPEDRTTGFSAATYFEAQLKPIPQLTVTTGLLVDPYDRLGRLAIEPRLWLRYQVAEGTAIEGGLGVFNQQPSVIESDTFFGNPDLRLQRAHHYGLGVEQRILRPLTLSVSAFYKDLDQLSVRSERFVERLGQRVPLRYDNVGIGRAYGLETMLRHEPTERLFGWISYTLMRSERRDGPDEEWRLFGFDQTHILTVVAGLRLPRGWEIGLRFQLASGRPFTPTVGYVYQSDCDSFQGVPGEEGSERLPLSHQLDLRIDKTWTIRRVVRLTLYLDVQNVYYHSNVEGYFYSYDFRQRYPISGLPILPTLGLAAEF